MERTEGRIWSWLKEPLSDLIIFTAGGGLLRWVIKMVKEHHHRIPDEIKNKPGEILNDRYFKHARGEFWDTIRKIEVAGGDTKNLRDRIAKAHEENWEDKQIKLICKLPQDPVEGWQPAIKWLNGMSDNDYYQTLYGLENDVVQQDFKRFLGMFKQSEGSDRKGRGATSGSTPDTIADLTESLPGARPSKKGRSGKKSGTKQSKTPFARIIRALFNSGSFLISIALVLIAAAFYVGMTVAMRAPEDLWAFAVVFSIEIMLVLAIFPRATLLLFLTTSIIGRIFALIAFMIVAAVIALFVPLQNDPKVALGIFMLFFAFLFLKFGNKGEHVLFRAFIVLAIVVGLIMLVLGGSESTVKTAGLIEHRVELAMASGQQQSPPPPHSYSFRQASLQMPFRPLIAVPSTFAALPNPNDPCPGMASEVVDYGRAFEMHPVAMGQPFAFDARGDRLFPNNCFGPVLDLGAFAQRGGFCGVPCYWGANGCEILDPDHTFRFWWQIVRQDASGSWIPVETVGPLHWTNLPSDNPNLLNPPLTLRLKGDHSPNGGMTFMTLGQGPGGAKCPEADWPNVSGSS